MQRDLEQTADDGLSPLVRRVAEVVASELAALQGDEIGGDVVASWSAGDDVAGDRIGVDSLELLAVATRVATKFELEGSGQEERLLWDRTLGAWARLIRVHGVMPVSLP